MNYLIIFLDNTFIICYNTFRCDFMEELIDVLDEFGNKTGIVKKKSDIKRDGDFHRAISVIIFDEDNNVLLQKRSSSKKIFANLWSIFLKGHIQAGETPIDACIREINEEVGLIANPDNLKYLYTLYEEHIDNDYIERIFFDTFFLRMKFKFSDITIQEEELSDVKLIPIDEVFSLFDNNDPSLVPNYEDYKKITRILKNK